MADYLFDLLVDYLVFICICFTIIIFMYVFSSFVYYYYRLLLLFRCLKPADVPVIMDEADDDILLDAQRPLYVKEEKCLLKLL
jgi:hypothetical protein